MNFLSEEAPFDVLKSVGSSSSLFLLNSILLFCTSAAVSWWRFVLCGKRLAKADAWRAAALFVVCWCVGAADCCWFELAIDWRRSEMFLMLLSSLGFLKNLLKVNFSFDFNWLIWLILLVTVSLALNFSQDVHSVVISQCTRHFVVIHRQMVLLNAPELCEASWVHDFKDAGVAALPGNIVAISLLVVVQKLLKEVPK